MLFFVYGYVVHPDLHVLTHSFPTLRSSDLLVQRRDVAAHRNGRIRLVEDDDQVAAMIREMLAALGYDSERALSGDAAVDLLDTDDNFDLVISDMHAGTKKRTGPGSGDRRAVADASDDVDDRSEEHTSELQSLMRISYAVFCLKKKNK